MSDPLLRVVEKVDRAGWPLATVALGLEGGGSLLYSPTARLNEPSRAALDEMGPPAFLLAPNHFHWMGIAEYKERHPEARIVASEKARERLGEKSPLPFEGLEALDGRLPPGVTLLEPPGCRTGEVWLRVEGAEGTIWVVSDAFFNVPKTPTGRVGWFCRLSGTTPGLRIGSTFKYLALNDRKKYAAWLQALLKDDPPVALIPSHGQVARGDDLAQKLADLARKRL